MRLSLAAFLAIVPAACGGGQPPVQGDDTAVSATVRLKDYLEYARFPEDSRPARADTPELSAWPGLPENRSTDAQFTGYAGESLVDGSLVVRVGVDVQKPGRFRFTSVLRDPADQKNVAVASVTSDLPAGAGTIQLLFYGLIFREARRGGPFSVVGVVGERLLSDDEVQQVAAGGKFDDPRGTLAPLRTTYTTQKYALDRFTKREYDSPLKRQRLEQLRREAEAERQAGAQP